jgi:hypothetical protein
MTTNEEDTAYIQWLRDVAEEYENADYDDRWWYEGILISENWWDDKDSDDDDPTGNHRTTGILQLRV